MSAPEGADIADVLRSLGKEGLLAEAERAGLKPRNGRMRCPFAGCKDKGEKERTDSVQVYPGKRQEWRLKCHRCGMSGSLVDLLAAVNGWTDVQAIAHLHGLPAPAPTLLRVVPPPTETAPDKLLPEEIKRVWDGLSASDSHGEAYLEGRGLGEAVELGLVRFAQAAHVDKRVQSWVRKQRLVVALMKDVVGNARGLQARLVRERVGLEPKISSLKGSSTSRAFFGNPELIESSAVVAVAEGMADTLALAGWAKGHEVAVVGAAGKDFLGNIAEELERCDIPVEGRIFALFPQNDRPQNKSRREFNRLGQLLQRRGARVVHVSTHDEYKDLADWLQATPDAAWPPPQLAIALGGEAVHETPETVRAVPAGCAVPVPAEVRAKLFAQDFTTLVTLIDDPSSREAIMGRGELSWCEMTHAPRLEGRPLGDADLIAIRLGVESQARSTDNKPLKFGIEDISQAVELIARRKTMHPVKKWITSQKWDGNNRLGIELPAALGKSETSFAATLLYRWMIAAVARAMKPGCKMDTVLVLVGPQGVGKSSFFSALAGDWFTDSPVNIGDKDGLLVMGRSWVVEWAELDAMRRARDQEAIKAFLSQLSDHYRPPYARRTIEVLRSCVIVGTTNHKEFLHDVTGNRRFWPVEVERVDLAWVRANREQLFAEALERFKAGEPWWLTPEEELLLSAENEEHEVQDAWVELVGSYVKEHLAFMEFTTAMLLGEALKKPSHLWTPADEQRIGRVMKALGWSKVRRSAGGKFRWVYERPL